MFNNHKANYAKIAITLALLIYFSKSYTFASLNEEGKNFRGSSDSEAVGKFQLYRQDKLNLIRRDRKDEFSREKTADLLSDLKENKKKKKLISRDVKIWDTQILKGVKIKVNQASSSIRLSKIQLFMEDAVQRRRLTTSQLISPTTTNNYFYNSFVQISSGPSSNPSGVAPASSGAYNQIAYTEYIKSNFPSLIKQPSAIPNSATTSTIAKTDQAISNLFSNIIKDLQNKITAQNQNIINKNQSQTTIKSGTQTKPDNTSTTPRQIPTNPIIKPTIGSQVNPALPTLVSTPKTTTSNQTITTTSKSLPPLPPLQVSFSNYLTALNPFFFVKSTPEIYYYREQIFLQFLDYINRFNKLPNRTYNMGLNEFTFLTQGQFTDRYLRKISPQALPNITNNSAKLTKNLPNISIDWRCKASAVVLNGECITSHILSAFQAIYITQSIYNMSPAELSVQEILSCGSDVNLKGCDGGYYSAVYKYVQVFGVGLSGAYPFEDRARVNKTISECSKPIINNNKYIKNKIFVTTGRIPNGDCEQVVKQLQKRAISVMIASKDLRFYKNGIYASPNSTPDHKVTLVGYDLDMRFLIKNTWGAQWGIQGYAYVSENTGVCNYAMYPILEKQGKISECES